MEELKTLTQENDIVLIHFEDKPLMFARIEDIQPDSKPDWYHVKLLILQMPLQVVTWILRDAYIDGDEFTMSGHKMRLEKVVCPEHPEEAVAEIEEMQNHNPAAEAPEPAAVIDDEAPDDISGGAEIISFKDRMKK